MRNNPEPGELHEAKLSSDQRGTRWFFFPSCDVQEEVYSIDCSFTCSHFESVLSPSRHLEKDKSWCLIPLRSSVQCLPESNKLPILSKNLILLSGFLRKTSWQELWEKDYPKEQWMAVLVCNSKAESKENYCFSKKRSSIFSIFWNSFTWAWV